MTVSLAKALGQQIDALGVSRSTIAEPDDYYCHRRGCFHKTSLTIQCSPRYECAGELSLLIYLITSHFANRANAKNFQVMPLDSKSGLHSEEPFQDRKITE